MWALGSNLYRLLKNAHLRRSPHPSSLQRTFKYASLLRISGVLHLGFFDQPEKNEFSNRLFIIDFAFISRTFPSDTKLKEQSASSSSEEISSSPTCGFLIAIYLFYENWSTETFSKEESKKKLFLSPSDRLFTVLFVKTASLNSAHMLLYFSCEFF